MGYEKQRQRLRLEGIAAGAGPRHSAQRDTSELAKTQTELTSNVLDGRCLARMQAIVLKTAPVAEPHQTTTSTSQILGAANAEHSELDLMRNFSLRSATESDKDFIFGTFELAMREYVEWAWGWDEESQPSHFWESFPLENVKVVCIADQPIGALYVEEHPKYRWIRTIFLKPEVQGMGIGSELVRREADLARNASKSLVLRVIKINPAKRLYERLGFKVVKEDEVTYSMQMA